MLYGHMHIYAGYIRNELIRRKHDNDKDARKKTQEDFFNNILPLTLLQGFERVRKGSKGLHVRGSWRPNINCNILTPLLWP